VFVDSGAVIEDAIVFDNCRIGRGAKVLRAIVDENTSIPSYHEIGYAGSRQSDTYEVSPGGVVLVTARHVRS
jgi:glucose-1-phosphate adenylyltransferase